MGQYPCRPLASVDIIGHEFGHGLLFNTTYIGNVGYDRDAIHEGLGDIWGLLFEHHITPNADIWKTGEDVMIGYDCERDFAYPNNPNAHTKIANTYNYGLYNTGDEHVKGGIASRWFYLLVNGGSGKNEKDDTYTVYSVGLDLAEELFTQTVLNSSYLANCSTFVQVRQAFVDAANDMENPFLAMQVANAWYAVGVGSQPTQINLSGSSTICPNSTATYTINNLPSGYTINWTINNSDFTISPSGNQCIVAYTGSQGYGMATLTANVYYNSYLIKQYTKSIQIGFPELDELEFYNYYGEGNWIEGNAGNIVTVAGGGSPYYDQYECDIYRLNNNGTETLVKHMCRPTPYFEFGYPWEGWFVVYIRGINDCGYSEWSFGEIECEAPENNGPDNLEDNGCRIVYSPDGNCLFISWTDEAMQRSAVMQKDGKASTYEVQIWNETKKVKSVSSNQQETRVPLAGLPKGFYIAKVIRDGKNCATKFSLW